MPTTLVLGHKGLLGNAVLRVLNSYGHTILTNGLRWDTAEFKANIREFNGDFIINCIGAIPQKNTRSDIYDFINLELPIFLDQNAPSHCKILHPTTDCEFNGSLPKEEKYLLSDTGNATDAYGISKYKFTNWCLKNGVKTKIIRTSIIGLELNSSVSLLGWFLNQTDSVRGYTDHFWNGITTIEWAKWAQKILSQWPDMNIITQLGTEKQLSKFELLLIIKKIWGKSIEIIPFQTGEHQNKCLDSEYKIDSLILQLEELKKWYI